MKENNFLRTRKAVRFRRFLDKPYAVFRSLKLEVNIGVLSVAMLTFANVRQVAAQTDTKHQEKLYELEEVEVTGSRAPLTVAQAARIVTVLNRDDIAAAPAQSINDLLKYAVGVDVRQRGGLGVQTDISIRGGTQDQITILLNGINICDPQTGHNTVEIPVDLSEIERIEVLKDRQAGSTAQPHCSVQSTSSPVQLSNLAVKSMQKAVPMDISAVELDLTIQKAGSAIKSQGAIREATDTAATQQESSMPTSTLPKRSIKDDSKETR